MLEGQAFEKSSKMIANSFQTPHGELYIYDVIDNHIDHLNELLALYGELFPQYVSSLSQLHVRAVAPANVDPRFIRHQWLLTMNGDAVALATFGLSFQRGIGFCLSIGIRPAFRSLTWGSYRRFSEFLIRQMVAQLEVDATRSGSRPPRGLVVEIEMSGPQSDQSRQHLLERYREYGFVPLPVTYHEPAFLRHSQAQNAQPMQLYFLPIHTDCTDILHDVVDTLLIDHYGLAEDDWIVQQARKSIEYAGALKNESRS